MKHFLFIYFILLLPFEDSILQNSPLGVFLSGMSVLPLLGIFFLTAGYFKKNITISLYFYLGCLASLIFSFAYLLINYSDASYISLLIDKMMKIFLLVFFYAYAILMTKENFSSRYQNYVIFAWLFSILGALLSLMAPDILESLPLIHATENGNMRVRGFSLESSTLGPQILMLTVVSMHLIRSKWKWILGLGCIILAILSGSKGTVAVLAISAILCSVIYVKKRPFLSIFFGIIIVPTVIFYTVDFLQDSFLMDFDSYTSTATRLTMIVTSCIIMLKNPFGVGYAGYLGAIYQNGNDAIVFIKQSFPFYLNFSEVATYFVAGETKNIDCKSLFFNLCIMFGFPFLLAYLYAHYKLIKRFVANSQILLIILTLFTGLSLIFFISGLGFYISAFVYGYLSYAYTQNSIR